MNALYNKRSGRAPKVQHRNRAAHGQGEKNPAASSKQNRAGLSLRDVRPEEALAGLAFIIALYAITFFCCAVDAGWWA